MFDRQFFEGKLIPAIDKFKDEHCKKGSFPGVELLLRDGSRYFVKEIVHAGEGLLSLLVYSDRVKSQIITPYGEIMRLSFIEKPPEPEGAFEPRMADE
jgi:hypothetical protein